MSGTGEPHRRLTCPRVSIGVPWLGMAAVQVAVLSVLISCTIMAVTAGRWSPAVSVEAMSQMWEPKAERAAAWLKSII